jgi:hypothetical protein
LPSNLRQKFTEGGPRESASDRGSLRATGDA